jgi:hypothetical protein
MKLENNLKQQNSRTKVSDEIILKYWKEGLKDTQIGLLVGLTQSAVGYRRRKLGLRHNDRSKITTYNSLTGTNHNAFIGHMLGDGTLNKRYEKGNARGLIFHSEKQLGYLNHKRKVFKELNPSEIKPHNKKWGDGKISKGFELYLPTNKYLTEIHSLLYSNKKRIITERYLKDYNEVSLAYHYMDDGHYHKRTNSYTICLAGFDDKSVNNYVKHLEQNLKLKVSVQSKNNIYIKAESRKKFEQMIINYIPKCMLYKTSYEAHVKWGELLGNQETDNQQPSFASNSFEGSTTSYQVLSDKSEDGNITTSALPVNLH